MLGFFRIYFCWVKLVNMFEPIIVLIEIINRTFQSEAYKVLQSAAVLIVKFYFKKTNGYYKHKL